jgi:magnesium-transporting ATPase (P-type)
VTILTQLSQIESEVNYLKNQKNIAIIIAGEALLKITAEEELKNRFIKVIDTAAVVIACRVSPLQKAEIV